MSTPDLHTGTVEWFDVERDLGLASCDDGSLPCTVHGRSARASGTACWTSSTTSTAITPDRSIRASMSGGNCDCMMVED